MRKQVIYINNWTDYQVSQIRDDVMLPVAKGIYYHYRLQLLIVVKDELPTAISLSLP